MDNNPNPNIAVEDTNQNLAENPVPNVVVNPVETQTPTLNPSVVANPAPTATCSNIIRLLPRPDLIPLPDIRNASEFVADNNLVMPDELVAGLMHRGTRCVLGGSSKAGKSWILIDLSLSVATGTPFLGMRTQLGRVLYVNLEIDAIHLQSRIRSIMRHRNIPESALRNLEIWNLRGQDITIERLLNDLRHRHDTQYALIVIDPLYKLLTGKSESNGSSASKQVSDFDKINKATGAAVVYTNHYSKGNQSKKRSIDRLGGSGVYARDADTIITLTEHRQPECFTVETKLRNMPALTPIVVEWTHPVMTLRPRINPNDLSQSEGNEPTHEEMNFVLHHLGDGSISTEEWMARVIEGGISAANFLRIRQQLQDRGEVIADGENSWSLHRLLPPPPPEPVPAPQPVESPGSRSESNATNRVSRSHQTSSPQQTHGSMDREILIGDL